MKCKNRILLAGVSCVGETTIGKKLGDLIGFRFYDLDEEVEAFYGASIERLQKQHQSLEMFRVAAADVLKKIISNSANQNCIVALPPRGLMNAYWKVVRAANATAVVISDNPENILNRITFFDINSNRRYSRKLL